jgi:hypothetical protein
VSALRLLRRFTVPTLLVALLAMTFALPPQPAAAQSVTTTGSDFYLAIPSQGDLAFTAPTQFDLYLVSSLNASVTISIADGSFSPMNVNVTAGTPEIVTLPNDSPTGANFTVHTHAAQPGVSQTGIRIQSDQPIAVAALSYVLYSADGTVIPPTSAGGMQYVVSSYPSAWAAAYFMVVAQEDGTVVEYAEVKDYTPEADNSNPDSLFLSDSDETYEEAADLKSVSLDAGEVFFEEYPYGSDPSGTLIRSNKPVTVYSGAQVANVPRNYEASDFIYEAMPPVNTWGSEFIVPGNAARTLGDTIRIYGWAADTEVSVDGEVIATLTAGQWLELRRESTAAMHVTSSSPVMLMRYFNSTQWDSQPGDPSMMLVPPAEQGLPEITFSTPISFTPEYTSYVSIVAPSTASVTLDGNNVASWTTVGSSGFKTAEVAIEPGEHTVSGDAPLQVLVYGVRFDESYAYAAGMAFNETWQPVWDFTAPPSAGERAAPRRCELLPDMAVDPQFIELAPGGTATIRVSLRNLCPGLAFSGADLLLSLSDGLTVLSGSDGMLNLGQRAAWQNLSLDGGELLTFEVLVQAPNGTLSGPQHVSELYYLGRVANRIDGVFLPAAAAAPVTPEAPAPAETPAAPAPLPAALPNTAGQQPAVPTGELIVLLTAILALAFSSVHLSRQRS